MEFSGRNIFDFLNEDGGMSEENFNEAISKRREDCRRNMIHLTPLKITYDLSGESAFGCGYCFASGRMYNI